MSPQTFTHTGYTGTQICADPTNDLFTILLTNRVYPTDAVGSTGVNAVRTAFSDMVYSIFKQGEMVSS
jgi:CubicO group peptidase (beta-lactamase class C family)